MSVMPHDPSCPIAPKAHSDAARHAADAVNLHLSAIGFDAVKKWVAVRLSDGRSDGVLYDHKRDAQRHQLDEQRCAYVCIPPNGMTACRAESFMATMRRLYDSGWRLTDPDDRDGGASLIPRVTIDDQARQMAALGKG